MLCISSCVKCVRINNDSEGIPRVFYKYNNTAPGWYPKPVEFASEADMQKLFKHDDPVYGAVLRYKEYSGEEHPGVAMGIRQTWFYDVTYSNNEVITFPFKCISLPIIFFSELIDLNTLSHQVYRAKICNKKDRETILNNIIKILTNRHLTDDIPSWQAFFSKLPVQDDYIFNNTLLNLINKYKRTIQVSLYDYIISMKGLKNVFIN